MDVLPPGWEDLSAKGLVALFVVMVLLGWLIPKRWHERAMREKDETIAFQRDAIEKLTSATQNLAVPAHTSATALRQIAKAADASKGGDE